MCCLEKTDWKKTTWVVLVQILFERCPNISRYFTKDWKIWFKSLQQFAFGKWSTFGFKLELSLISKQSLKRKGLSCFQKCISKRSLPKWFERVEFIWFYLIPQKSYSKKNLNMCIKSFVGLQKKMGIENLLSSFLK